MDPYSKPGGWGLLGDCMGVFLCCQALSLAPVWFLGTECDRPPFFVRQYDTPGFCGFSEQGFLSCVMSGPVCTTVPISVGQAPLHRVQAGPDGAQWWLSCLHPARCFYGCQSWPGFRVARSL